MTLGCSVLVCVSVLAAASVAASGSPVLKFLNILWWLTIEIIFDHIYLIHLFLICKSFIIFMYVYKISSYYTQFQLQRLLCTSLYLVYKPISKSMLFQTNLLVVLHPLLSIAELFICHFHDLLFMSWQSARHIFQLMVPPGTSVCILHQ